MPKERRRRGDVKDGDDAAGGDDGVRMYEKREGDLLRGADADDDALFGSGNSKDRKKVGVVPAVYLDLTRALPCHTAAQWQGHNWRAR